METQRKNTIALGDKELIRDSSDPEGEYATHLTPALEYSRYIFILVSFSGLPPDARAKNWRLENR